jgi:endoglucanase
MANIKLIERLSNATGISGDEREVKNILKDEIKGYIDSLSVDPLGNLFAVKGLEKEGPKVLLNAHMDEVGLVISSIDDKGFLCFKPVGGVDARLFVGKRVLIGENKLHGVIGAKAIHLQGKDELGQALDISKLCIDIGANDPKEAEKLVPLGSLGTFDTKFEKILNGKYIGKAFDDRLGCAIITELLKEMYKFPLMALFSSQEEIGSRGASVGAFKYTPDISITIEGTISADLPEVKDHLKCSKLGDGPVITIKDRSVITDNELRKNFIGVAKQKNIPYQFKQVIAGGTDSSKIQLTKSGVKVLVVAVPVRYIHSPVGLFYESDYENTKNLISEFLKILKGG